MPSLRVRVLVSHTLRKEEGEMLKTSFTVHLRTILPLGFCQLPCQAETMELRWTDI